MVLGGTGFVGGRLAERLLLEQDARVRVSVRDWRKAVWIARSEAELVSADVTDAESLLVAMRDCEMVVHCASGPAQSGGYMRTNREGTGNVVAACRAAGVRRLVYVSTVAVHAARPGMTLSSSSPLQLTGRDYSDSKIEAERLVERAEGLETVILRPTYVWGPRSNAFTVRQVREMMQGTFMYVDDGSTVANAVYVDNLVDALIAAMVSETAVGRSYLVTDGEGYSWRSLFDGYARLLEMERFHSVSSRSPLAKLGAGAVARAESVLHSLRGPRSLPVRALRRAAKISRDRLRRRYVDAFELNKFACNELADIDATRRDLGYSPRYDLDAGLADTLRWIEDPMGFEIDTLRRAPGRRA